MISCNESEPMPPTDPVLRRMLEDVSTAMQPFIGRKFTGAVRKEIKETISSLLMDKYAEVMADVPLGQLLDSTLAEYAAKLEK